MEGRTGEETSEVSVVGPRAPGVIARGVEFEEQPVCSSGRGEGRVRLTRGLERGEYSPSLHLALRIVEHFEVPVEVIFSTSPLPRIGSG